MRPVNCDPSCDRSSIEAMLSFSSNSDSALFFLLMVLLELCLVGLVARLLVTGFFFRGAVSLGPVPDLGSDSLELARLTGFLAVDFAIALLSVTAFVVALLDSLWNGGGAIRAPEALLPVLGKLEGMLCTDLSIVLTLTLTLTLEVPPGEVSEA